MKRLFLAATTLAVIVGCSQAQTAQPAQLTGLRSTALVGDLLIVTSTERNELRALDLVPPVTINGKEFLPAPNPLEKLAIPVLDRPTRLSRDVSYAPLIATDGTLVQEDGLEVGGPFVYASSPGTAAISIVGATEDLLVELARFPTAAPVTATAGTRVGSGMNSTSRLYFATDNGKEATLYKLDLPSPTTLNETRIAKGKNENLAVLKETTLETYPGSSIVELLTLPGERLVVVTRRAQGKQGEAFVLNVGEAPNFIPLPLDFGGPVRALATHPATVLGEGPTLKTLEAGARLYGLLDEAACGGPACGGIVAVDSRTGARAKDFSGQPMLTLKFGDVLPVGLSVFARAPFNAPPPLGPTTVPLLGVVTTSVGDLAFFDAGGLTYFDADVNTARVTVAPVTYAAVVDASGRTSPGAPVAYAAGPVVDSIVPGEGASLDEEVAVVQGGAVHELPEVSLLGTTDELVSVGAEAVMRMRVADTAVFSSLAGNCTGALTALTATTVTVHFDAPCPAGKYLAVFAAGPASPFVVAGSRSGFMGRTSAGSTFSYQGTVYSRVKGQAALTFRMGEDSVASMPRVWRFTVASGFAPYMSYIDTSNTYSTVAACAVHMPGPISYWLPGAKAPLTDIERANARLFVAFPSANGVIELVPATVTPGAIASNVVCYR